MWLSIFSDWEGAISAWSELAATGEFGDSGLGVLFRIVRSELSRLPILLDGRELNDDLVWEFAQEFFVARGVRATAALLAECDDDESFGRLLRVTVRNWLIDEVRRTDVGSVSRRIGDLLIEERAFEVVPDGEPGAGRWRPAGSRKPPWGGGLEDLVAAAYRVPAKAVPWESETRRPPIAARPDIVAVLTAVFRAAGHQSLELRQIVAVIVRRFPHTLDPERRRVDERTAEVAATGPTPEVLVVDQEDEIEAAASAVSVYGRLTSSERRLLPLIHDVEAVRAELECGRSTAYTRIANLRALILELTGEYDDPEQVVREVLELCRF